MEIPVLIERVAGNGYRAKSGGPLELTVEGATREEVLQRLRDLLRHPPAGQELAEVTIPVQPSQKPRANFAGMFKDDPYFDEVVEIMAENRREMDADPDVP